MDKETIKSEIKSAYKERNYKYEMLNYVDADFTDAVVYEIKAIDCKINALQNMLKVVPESNKEKASKFWSGYILSCMNTPIGAKKETAVDKQIGF